MLENNKLFCLLGVLPLSLFASLYFAFLFSFFCLAYERSGQNGAGKSTTINMMTGVLQPSSGDARVFGYSIRSDMNAIRRVMGVCPQARIPILASLPALLASMIAVL